MISVSSSISKRLGFWSVNHASMYKHYELNVFKNMKFYGEISNNWPSNILGANVYKTLDFYW